MKKISAIILARGPSVRIKKDKAFLKIGEQTFVERIIQKIAPVCNEIIISTKRPAKWTKYSKRAKVIKDSLRVKSSLVGIYSGLKASRNQYALILACDIPLISISFIQRLVSYTPRFDIIIPQTANGLEPLCAIYSKRCLAPIKKLMESGDFKILNFFDSVRVKYVKTDLHRAGLININTVNDYRKLSKLI
jgi:molybdopterin-guanine dinucleotide biosynthesis protein A